VLEKILADELAWS